MTAASGAERPRTVTPATRRSPPLLTDLEPTRHRALHLRRPHRRRDRQVGQRRQLPHALRARDLHRRGRNGGACGRGSRQRDGGADHVPRHWLAPRDVGRGGERSDASGDPGRQRRDLRARPVGAPPAGNGDDGHRAGPARGRYLIGQVGDSRAYLLRDGQFLQLTKDHSYVQELVDAGLLTPDQARGHPYSSIITRCVGASERWCRTSTSVRWSKGTLPAGVGRTDGDAGGRAAHPDP